MHPAREQGGCECKQWRCTLMSRAYWRTPGAYKELQTFDAPGFASQFVKRHPDYVRDRERLQEKERHGTLDPAEADAFARRWGLLLPDDD